MTSGGEEEESAAEDNSRKEKTFAWNVCSSVEVFPECLVGSHGSGVPHTLLEEQEESLTDSLWCVVWLAVPDSVHHIFQVAYESYY
jgi:hypothetical protein